MIPLVLGLLLFVGIHLLPTQPAMDSGLKGRFGEGRFKAFFSIVSLVGLVLIVVGYHKIQIMPGKNPQLWAPPAFGRHVTLLLMLPVFPLLIATYLPGRIAGAVRHPMITAVILWALAHLFVRGDAASLLLFGSLLAWAIYDRLSFRWREMDDPLTRPKGPLRNDAIAIVAGLLIYGVFLKWGHAWLIGVPLLPQ